jgi:hypothetical protein
MSKQKMSVFKNEGQKCKTSPVWGFIPVEDGTSIR